MNITIHLVLWEKNLKHKWEERALIKVNRKFEMDRRTELNGDIIRKILAKYRE